MEASSSGTGLAVFKFKMSVACCVTEIIWLHMSYSKLKRLNKVKAVFHRLRHWNIYNIFTRIFYLLAEAQYFIHHEQLSLSNTDASKRFHKERWAKKRHNTKIPINPCNERKVSNLKLCYLYTRTELGFLYCICNQSDFQDIWTCKCTMHGEYCLWYNILLCSERIYSLTHYTNDENFVQL